MSESKRNFEYRGHRVELTREECLGGWVQTYYYVTDKGGYELECDFSESEDTLNTWEDIVKARIDEELECDHPWQIGASWISEDDVCIIKDGNLIEVQCCEVSYP